MGAALGIIIAIIMIHHIENISAAYPGVHSTWRINQPSMPAIAVISTALMSIPAPSNNQTHAAVATSNNPEGHRDCFVAARLATTA